MMNSTQNHTARRRAISLIEGVLYLVIALAVIIGGIVFFQQAQMAAQINRTLSTMSTVSAQLTPMLKTAPRAGREPGFEYGDMTRVAIKSDMVPGDMVGETAAGDPLITTPWGGVITFIEVTGIVNDSDHFPVLAARINDVPRQACMRLTTKSVADESPLGSNAFMLGIEENGVTNKDWSWYQGDPMYGAGPGMDIDKSALATSCNRNGRDIVVYYKIDRIPDGMPRVWMSATGEPEPCAPTDLLCQAIGGM